MRRLIFFVLLVASVALLASRAQAQVIVIANPSVKSADVSKNDLRDVFSGGASSLNGSQVTPVLLKSGGTHEEFLRTYVGKNDTALRAGWRSLVFSGQASMPRSLDSEAAVVEYVSHTVGALGYIGKTTPHEGVKVLAVR